MIFDRPDHIHFIVLKKEGTYIPPYAGLPTNGGGKKYF